MSRKKPMRVPLRLGRYTLTRALSQLQNGMLPQRVMQRYRSSLERKRASNSSGLVGSFPWRRKLRRSLFGDKILIDINLPPYRIEKWALFLNLFQANLLYVDRNDKLLYQKPKLTSQKESEKNFINFCQQISQFRLFCSLCACGVLEASIPISFNHDQKKMNEILLSISRIRRLILESSQTRRDHDQQLQYMIAAHNQKIPN